MVLGMRGVHQRGPIRRSSHVNKFNKAFCVVGFNTHIKATQTSLLQLRAEQTSKTEKWPMYCGSLCWG